MAGDEDAAYAAGCTGYISKPINTRTLGDQVREFLAAGPA
jgi:CheY-like chemotaxis protein